MRRLTLILSLMLALVGLKANAAMYIVGNNPFGNWHTYTGAQMTDDGNGVYTYVTDQINGTVWFVFADNLTPGPNDDWTMFNGNYRYGPTNSGQPIDPNTEYTTQKSTNGNASYSFNGQAGQSYQFTFNTNTMKFKVEGYVPPVEITTYSVAGEPAAVFGETTWNEKATETEMTLVDGLYTWIKNGVELSSGTTIAFKIVGNHDWGYAWPAENYTHDITESGTYDLVFTIDPETKNVGFAANKVQDGPVVDPITGKLFALGQVNGNNWDPSTGIEMATTDEDIFTLTGATFADSGDGYAWFSFTSKLGENANDWSFGEYRRGALADGTLVEDGVNADLADWGTTAAFKVLPGIYDVEVSLSSDYVKLVKKSDIVPVVDDVYIIGDVNNYEWDPTQGIQMDYAEGIYTATVNATKREGQDLAYVGFTKKLADTESETPWDDIEAYRFGPVSEDAFVMTQELLGVECDLATDGSYNSIAVPEGAWTVTVDLVNNKFTVNGEWPTDTIIPEPVVDDVYVFGDVNNYEWDPTQGIQMDYAEGIYTATVNATKREGQEYAYVGFTKKLADTESETPWDDIEAYRFGPESEGAFVMTEELLGTECALATNGSYESIALPEGEWTITVNLENNKFTVNGEWPVDTVVPEPYTGEVYILGEVNGNGWAPNVGAQMVRDAENNVYTAIITTDGKNVDENDGIGYNYFSFTKQLAEDENDWDGIGAYRFGAVSEGDFLVTSELIGQELSMEMYGDAYKIPAGSWQLTLDVDNMKLTINYLRGDVDGNGIVNISDVIKLVSAIQNSDFTGVYQGNTDVNDDTKVNISDVTRLVNYILNGNW